MTGSAEPASLARGGWVSRLAGNSCRYLAVDGGAGAELLGALAGIDPRLEAVDSPRHADLLLAVEPIGRRLAQALAEITRAMPRPVRVLVVSSPNPGAVPRDATAPSSDPLPGARRAKGTTPGEIAAEMLDCRSWPETDVRMETGWKPDLVPLDAEKELETEFAVLSLGPIQPFTAGPLRIVLICDGGQVVSARVEAGYAHRGVASAMAGVGWSTAEELASTLDPLAPMAGRLAFRRAVDALQGCEALPVEERQRELVLALERSRSHLWWLVRFLRLLEISRSVDRAVEAVRELDQVSATVQEESRGEDTSNRNARRPTLQASSSGLRPVADRVRGLRNSLASDRLLALRTRGIGFVSSERLKQAGVGGPTLLASEHGAGDVQARILARLDGVIADLAHVCDVTAEGVPRPHAPPLLPIPSGAVETVAEGPRGELRLRVVSKGGDGPTEVEFTPASQALLAVVPDLLAGQKVADAGLILASLDLSMAEVDG